ncbi:SET domain-containing protein [Xylariaceae sp. FL0594]|nr:SET domain-containing protein [Xylariaceae sp. FL0594]
MDPIQELVEWATNRGVRLNGIAPQRIPGRGTGIVALRDIEAEETVLDVPTRCIRTFSTVPKSRLRKLPENMSVQGILAVELALDDKSTEYASWTAICPAPEDFLGMPLLWEPEMQSLLPLRCRELLATQKAKFARDWAHVSSAAAALQDLGGEDRFRYAWLLVNTRTFYYLNAALKRRPGTTKDDHLALQPIADLFNHGDDDGGVEGGGCCRVAFGSEGFTFRATAPLKEGDEVKICYGRHGGDFLLVEYGFIMRDNRWDETLLDEVVLERLDEEQRERLDEAGFLGGYVLDRGTVCHRTQVALRLLCCKVGEWKRFVSGADDGEGSQDAVDELLLELLRQFRMRAESRIEQIHGLDVGEPQQRGMLIERWEQIVSLLETRITSLEAEQRL